jgi:hypothetical protein
LPKGCSYKIVTRRWYERALQKAIRSRDPFQVIDGTWLIRRLSPDSNPIEMARLRKIRDEETPLFAMGGEAANVHVGTPRQVSTILTDLRRRKPKWLGVAAKARPTRCTTIGRRTESTTVARNARLQANSPRKVEHLARINLDRLVHSSASFLPHKASWTSPRSAGPIRQPERRPGDC